MDAVLFQEKMEPTHRMYLCRMLNVKDLSEDLLGRYAQVKTLLDRIDGHLTPCGLALIIVSVGNNPEIATELAEVGAPAIVSRTDEIDVEPPVLDESDDKVIEEAVETEVMVDIDNDGNVAPVSGATGQAQEKPDPDEGKAMLWSPGMPVRVLHKEELKPGKIVNVSCPSDVGKQVGAAVKLTVEFEGGETETFDEKEVEAD